MKLSELNYGIVGLGIMGGSFAKSIRENILCGADVSAGSNGSESPEDDSDSSGAHGKIYVCNRSTACLSSAKSEGIADAVFTSDQVSEMLPLCDVVFVCLYPHATVDFLKEHKDHFKTGAIVTDISGVKGIFSELNDSVRDDVDFIIGHPMAGGEKEGYQNSNAKFFVNHNYILCPSDKNRAENISLMKDLIYAMGFSRITETSCDTHDYKIGFTSQLCHVIASALVESAGDPAITAFGGGSFEDLTRIAMINAPLWTELFTSNKDKLVEHIENFESELGKLKKLISDENKSALTAYLSDVREKRIEMSTK